jgi:hypothetical protein
MKVSTLLRVKKNWCQHNYAKDRTGRGVMFDSSSAESFCLLGAVRRCYAPSEALDAVERLERAIQEEVGNSFSIAAYNDASSRTFSQIKKIIKLANI